MDTESLKMIKIIEIKYFRQKKKWTTFYIESFNSSDNLSPLFEI